MKEEALKLADSIDEFAQGGYSYKPSDFLKVSAMIRQQAKRIEELETVLQSIANEHLELSHDKIKWQVQDHIRWAKDVLKEY